MTTDHTTNVQWLLEPSGRLTITKGNLVFNTVGGIVPKAPVFK